VPAAERVRLAAQRRGQTDGPGSNKQRRERPAHGRGQFKPLWTSRKEAWVQLKTDYIFRYWPALGWTIVTFGIYGFYVFYQLIRRMRDHNARRLELLDAATTAAWEQAGRRGLQQELTPSFQRAAGHLAVLRQMTGDFRDPKDPADQQPGQHPGGPSCRPPPGPAAANARPGNLALYLSHNPPTDLHAVPPPRGHTKTADAVLRRCPKVHLPATSREPLGIGGETIYWP
jgi:hypothetical protein